MMRSLYRPALSRCETEDELENHQIIMSIPSVELRDNGNSASQPVNWSLTSLIPDVMDLAVAYFPNGYASSAYDYEGFHRDTRRRRNNQPQIERSQLYLIR
ncbi:hypothetical protein HanXRQr2_Chr16g0757521 [Helianthus annuus]|uniref:Uncharacterized protein n=1 Tax=Helianthus annuus TaxID=4232 RepID=A0A9K3DU00_HELAN|nr:hypothetical protein HanXRQr2_Chr16g0757521 [Helianthus annuus]KAJ0438761.1 hypothetical protein HanHA300_Chr16g0617751 [Helianthus annuus]KAJ0443647.1 hypothetical protein HanIR_Chr16g0823081 [Helianthus annuus]KAJ0461113.1 hypothetical protein HanHA89_Chr16g0668641 [Helianthus annuus]KAJ0641536.1 hypothetical protein HanLR1_Chr16g0628341 [Helianthus annuus]